MTFRRIQGLPRAPCTAAMWVSLIPTVSEISQPSDPFSFKLLNSRTGLDQGGVPVMKKVLLGGVALITLGFVGAAAAADMPVKAPPPVVVNTWTGYYVGVDFGGINGGESHSFSQGPGFGA